jgi:hypothetical protein
MSATNRAKLIAKLHAALKKHYQPVVPDSRPLLEHILYGSLLQDASYALADEGMAKCEQDFFDWNEVRVTTVTELSQVLSNFPDPGKTAQRLKGNLQDVFEEFYTFDLDHLKKENLGKAVAKFEKMANMTPFVLAYTVQHGLAGHSIPVDYAALVVMLATEVISQNEASDGRVPGIERAIPKNKGAEFSSLLHQCAVALMVNTNDKIARTVLEATSKGSSARLDDWLASKSAAKKRVQKRKAEEKAAADEEIAHQKSSDSIAEKSKSTTKKTPAAETKKVIGVTDKEKTVAKGTTKVAPKSTASVEGIVGKDTAAQEKDSKATSGKEASVKKDVDSKKTEPKKSDANKPESTKIVSKISDSKKSAAKPASVGKIPAKPVVKASESKKTTPDKSSSGKAPVKPTSEKKSLVKKPTSEKKSVPVKSTPSKSAPSKSASESKPISKKTTSKKIDNRKISKKKPR